MTDSASDNRRSRKPNPTILGSLDGHNNSLGLLRLVFALTVIVSHAFPLGGFSGQPRFGPRGCKRLWAESRSLVFSQSVAIWCSAVRSREVFFNSCGDAHFEFSQDIGSHCLWESWRSVRLCGC